MTAKEMFEKIGYKLIANDEDILEYELEIIIDDYESFTYNIIFWLYDKEIEAYKSFGLEELQAINKQVEELGWNNVSITN